MQDSGLSIPATEADNDVYYRFFLSICGLAVTRVLQNRDGWGWFKILDAWCNEAVASGLVPPSVVRAFQACLFHPSRPWGTVSTMQVINRADVVISLPHHFTDPSFPNEFVWRDLVFANAQQAAFMVLCRLLTMDPELITWLQGLARAHHLPTSSEQAISSLMCAVPAFRRSKMGIERLLRNVLIQATRARILQNKGMIAALVGMFRGGVFVYPSERDRDGGSGFARNDSRNFTRVGRFPGNNMFGLGMTALAHEAGGYLQAGWTHDDIVQMSLKENFTTQNTAFLWYAAENPQAILEEALELQLRTVPPLKGTCFRAAAKDQRDITVSRDISRVYPKEAPDLRDIGVQGEVPVWQRGAVYRAVPIVRTIIAALDLPPGRDTEEFRRNFTRATVYPVLVDDLYKVADMQRWDETPEEASADTYALDYEPWLGMTQRGGLGPRSEENGLRKAVADEVRSRSELRHLRTMCEDYLRADPSAGGSASLRELPAPGTAGRNQAADMTQSESGRHVVRLPGQGQPPWRPYESPRGERDSERPRCKGRGRPPFRKRQDGRDQGPGGSNN